MLLYIEKLKTCCCLSNLLVLFLMRGNLYSVRDFDKKLTETFKELYQRKVKTLKTFSNSEFYDIKLEDPCLSLEMNRLICNFITSSASTDFNIFIEFACTEKRRTRVPNNLYFFTLKKIFENDFMFEIKYKNICDKTLPFKQKRFFLEGKDLKYLLNCIFNVTLFLRKFYPDSVRMMDFFYKYSFSNYRFMLFDSQFHFRNIIGLPDKVLKRHFSLVKGNYKPVLSTKLKLSGKLPGFLYINNVDCILKKFSDLFSNLNQKYKIKTVWRFENNLAEIESDEKLNQKSKSFCLKIFSTDSIQEILNYQAFLIPTLLTLKDYSINFEFTLDGSIELPGFTRETKMHLSWLDKSHNIKFYLQEHNTNIKTYFIDSSLFYGQEYFRIFSNNDLIITNIVDKVNKIVLSSQLKVYLNDYESTADKLFNEFNFRL